MTAPVRPPSVRFVWKVLGVTVAAVLAAMVVAGVSSRADLEDHWRERVERQASEEVHVVADYVEVLLERGFDNSVQREVQEYVDRVAVDLAGSRITVIDSEGWVIADTHESPRLMDNHAERPELTDLGAVVERYSRTVRTSMLYCAVVVPVGLHEEATSGVDEKVFVRVARASDDLADTLGGYTGGAAGGLWRGVTVGLLIALVGSMWVTRSLRDLAKDVAHGDGRDVMVAGNDEVAFVAESLNAQATSHRARIVRLEQALDRDHAIFASMEEGVLILDRDGRVRLVNAAARRLLGMGEGDVKRRALIEVTESHEVVVAVTNSLDTDTRTLQEVRLPTDGNGDAVIHLSAVPLGEPGSPSWGCVVVLYDLTEIRRLEAMRRDFVANVSHELKTPLTSMKGYLEAVLDDDEMPAEIRQRFLSKAERNTDRLSAIVSDLLALARMQGDAGVDFDLIDISALVESCARELRGAAEERDVAIVTDVAGSDFEMQGDEPALVSAVRNLIDNAIKYSPENSEVRVCASREGEAIVIYVRDEGQGIPLHEQERIFERFYRVDKNRSRELGGTGLGLSIVKNAVLAHGGEVSVTSLVGQGSTFTIRLPVS